ncbi:hypothetical protein SAMN05421644_11446 [Allochromatium warmingii]|uniref:Uncharacterized protein n=1 Tax=Allochromatium warmingii TaxID=61595 RepID=A0A1H3ER60_ALLWA|nr:hypothetical protein [Allochromatium warmingii]SDX81232.1 hypothetical protein SAMN05421644_11446 [Allochromatium warmingii]
MRDTTRRSLLRSRLFAATVPVLFLTTPAVFAASECKGLDQATCAAREECRWMDGYTRKDGIQVSSHCRMGKPRSKDAAATPTAAQASAPTTSAPAAKSAPAATTPAAKAPASTTPATPKAP